MSRYHIVQDDSPANVQPLAARNVSDSLCVGYRITNDYAILVYNDNCNRYGFAYGAQILRLASRFLTFGDADRGPARNISLKFASSNSRQDAIKKALDAGRKLYAADSMQELVFLLIHDNNHQEDEC